VSVGYDGSWEDYPGRNQYIRKHSLNMCQAILRHSKLADAMFWALIEFQRTDSGWTGIDPTDEESK
jgi:hypothetical protein